MHFGHDYRKIHSSTEIAWRGRAWQGGGHAWQAGVHGRGACVAGGHAWQGWARTPPDTMIYGWSMRGRYASYWNAFLFSK